eukprot:2853933-Alexandrium_andersonii.AAC.1
MLNGAMQSGRTLERCDADEPGPLSRVPPGSGRLPGLGRSNNCTQTVCQKTATRAARQDGLRARQARLGV